jgi:hypothetical protein
MTTCRNAIATVGQFQRQHTRLGAWLIDARVRDLRDAAVCEDDPPGPWSNGQTEGQINKLKTLKRAMYGRAGVDLLRARMMPLQEEGCIKSKSDLV